MLFLANDILDYAQMEQKNIQINKDIVNIRELFSSCTDILTFQAESKGLAIIIDIPSSFPNAIITDPNRLR